MQFHNVLGHHINCLFVDLGMATLSQQLSPKYRDCCPVPAACLITVSTGSVLVGQASLCHHVLSSELMEQADTVGHAEMMTTQTPAVWRRLSASNVLRSSLWTLN